MDENYRFRGKMTDSTAESVNCDGDRWVQGFYVEELRGGTMHPIITDGAYEFEVDKDTVGQFVYLDDKNLTHIYTGDILKDEQGVLYIVKMYSTDSFIFFGMEPIKKDDKDTKVCGLYKSDKLEVVGNIYDNKELLEE